MPEFEEKVPLEGMFDVIGSFFTFDAPKKRFIRHKRTLPEIVEKSGHSKKYVSRLLKILRAHGYLDVKKDRKKKGRGQKPNIYFLKIEDPDEVISYPDERDPDEPETELFLVRDGLRRKLSYLEERKGNRTKHIRTLTVLENRMWKRTKGLPSWDENN